jgi:prepilin-type N-terminal cleavage/methylation domain-containing protein
MNRSRGFTLVELLITMTIVIILLTLTVVGLRTSQANARDEERKTDVENLARGLELRYINGNPKATSTDIVKGAYPGINEILHGLGWDRGGYTPSQIVGGYMPDLLPGISTGNLTPPNGSFNISCIWACQPAETQSYIDSVTTINNYVYEPIDRSNNVCGGNACIRFNLYYRTEKDNVVHKVMSKHQ